MYVLDVGEQSFVGQQQIRIAVAGVIIFVIGVECCLFRSVILEQRVLNGLGVREDGLANTYVADVGDAVLQRLPVEHVAYRVGGIGLVLVLRKLELHNQLPQMM